jgi:hypothetical protein
MPVALSERGQRVMDSLPHYYATDPATISAVAAATAEQDRIEAMLIAIRDGAFPQRADDTYNMLPIWESMLGLPVKPADVPLDARRNKVMGFRRRSVAKAREWVEALTTALGTADWSWVREAGKRVTISFPYVGGSYDAATVEKLARAITPTHIEVVATPAQGFIVGVSRIGVENL